MPDTDRPDLDFSHADRLVEGVRIESLGPCEGEGAARDIILVHGGCHGSWCFEHLQPFLASAGWRTHAINWFGHHGSDALAPEVAIRRSLAAVSEEIGVAAALGRTAPILIGHSMGGLSALAYAARNEVAALVLLAASVSEQAWIEPVMPPPDPNGFWGPPPFEIARRLFLGGLEEGEARRYYRLLCAESPVAVHEATQRTLSVDPARIRCPILSIGGEDDALVPPKGTRKMAAVYGARYVQLEGRSHNLLLDPRWRETAGLVKDWLGEHVP